jgi:hypothetical protein
MFSSLHKEENKPANGWTVSRFKFFNYVFMGSVAFYFLPGLLFPALSWFNVVTWFAPRNVVVANLVSGIWDYKKVDEQNDNGHANANDSSASQLDSVCFQ